MILLGLVYEPDKVSAIPAQGWVIIASILSYLTLEAKQAGGFFFGGSASGQSKDATIAEIAKAP